MRNIIVFVVSSIMLLTAITANAGGVVCADFGSQAEAECFE
ncbi:MULTISPECIES: hypothetical protein [Gammaproteobacteria]|nr:MULTISPECIES: hypothetical protein [unclassified Psychrobacter]